MVNDLFYNELARGADFDLIGTHLLYWWIDALHATWDHRKANQPIMLRRAQPSMTPMHTMVTSSFHSSSRFLHKARDVAVVNEDNRAEMSLWSSCRIIPVHDTLMFFYVTDFE